MSLLRLLTTGRCLEGHKDAEPRYRLTSQRLLPKFGPDRNPFCAKEKAAAPRASLVEADERAAACSPEPKAAASPEARRDFIERPAPSGLRLVAASASAKSRGMVTALQERTTALRESWSGKLSRLFSHPASKPFSTVKPLAAKPAVQGELSLDRIKVVRNDLSDADLEVVGAKPAHSAAVGAPAPRPAEKTEVGALAWRRLAARVCGVDRH